MNGNLDYPYSSGPKRRGLFESINDFNDQFRRSSTVREENDAATLYEFGMGQRTPLMFSSREDGSSRTSLRRTRCPYCRSTKEKSAPTCGRNGCMWEHEHAMEEP